MSRVACIVGLPGVGKTRLGLSLAAAMAARGGSVLLLHTDVLKVTGRALVEEAPRGPVWQGDLDAKTAWMAALLDVHADKAAADGYDLVVEGTLAVTWRRGVRFHLQLDEPARLRRAQQKHRSARESIQVADLTAYCRLLENPRGGQVTPLDASLAVPALVCVCLEELAKHD